MLFVHNNQGLMTSSMNNKDNHVIVTSRSETNRKSTISEVIHICYRGIVVVAVATAAAAVTIVVVVVHLLLMVIVLALCWYCCGCSRAN